MPFLFFFPSWFQIYFCIPYIFLGHPINPFSFASGRRSGILLHNLNCENFTTFYNIFVNGTLSTPFVIVGIVRQKGKTWFKSFQNQLKPYFSSLKKIVSFFIETFTGPVRPQRGHCVKIWRSYAKRSSRYGFILIIYTKLVKLVDRSRLDD